MNATDRSAWHRQDGLPNAYEDVAKAEGWLVISGTARPGLVQRLTEEYLPTLHHEHDPRQTKSNITAVSLPGGVGAAREVKQPRSPTPSLRSQLNLLVDIVGQSGGGGLPITVDDITNEKPSLADLRDLGDITQRVSLEQPLGEVRTDVEFGIWWRRRARGSGRTGATPIRRKLRSRSVGLQRLAASEQRAPLGPRELADDVQGARRRLSTSGGRARACPT